MLVNLKVAINTAVFCMSTYKLHLLLLLYYVKLQDTLIIDETTFNTI